MAGGSYPIRSLVQGISQQEPSARGSANADHQENCINEVLDGAVSRMGTIVKRHIAVDYQDPFIHEISRDSGEQYIVFVEGGQLRVVNKVTGADCAVTGSIATYLAHTGSARKAFQAVTIGDSTFLLNRQMTVEMDTVKSPARPNQANAHFKAGGYKIT